MSITNKLKMSITNKLNKVYENTPKVYEAGRKAGGGGCDVDHAILRQEGYNDGFADGQASVPAGKRILTGTFTIDKNIGTPTITHNCGFIPTFFIVYPIDEYPNEPSTENQMILGCVMTNSNHFDGFSKVAFLKQPNNILEIRASSIEWGMPNTNAGVLYENTVQLGYGSGARLWRANFQYGWIAIE